MVESGNRGIVQQAMDIELKKRTVKTWKAGYAEELQKREPWSTTSRKKDSRLFYAEVNAHTCREHP